MPNVTKKIYGTAIYNSQVKDYVIASSGTVATNGDFNIIELHFDISTISSADVARMIIAVTKASVTNVGSTIDSSKIQKFIEAQSAAKTYLYNSFSTGDISLTLNSDGIGYLIENNLLKVYIDARILSYGGNPPSTMSTLCRLTINVDESSSYIECTTVEPVITSFLVEGNSIDSNIVCTWQQEDVDNWTLEVLQSNIVIATRTGTTISGCTFLPGDIVSGGNTTFRLTASKGTNYKVVSQDVNLLFTQVKIINVEPDGVAQRRDSNIILSFTGNNITSYSIVAKQLGIAKFSQSGTNESGLTNFSFTMVSNLFENGEVEIVVEANYVGTNYQNNDSMTAKFNVYGNPSIPIITAEQEYSTPFPTIYIAESDSYVSYILEIDGIEQSERYGNITEFTPSEPLGNEEYHTIKLKVKNQYQLWSSYARCTFFVSYSSVEEPQINVYANERKACIIINCESGEQENFRNHSILRKENGTWREIAKELERIDTYEDSTCASQNDYEYKARAYDVYGGFKDSKIKKCSCQFEKTMLSIPFTDISVQIEYYKSESDVQKPITYNTSKSYVEVCGLSVPKLKNTTLKYRVLPINVVFKTKEKLEEFLKLENEDILLFRDKNGEKMYCSMSITTTQNMSRYYKGITITLTECYFKEGDYIEAEDHSFTWNKEEY